jgi:SAM-dependent methyltransferase
MDDTVPDLADQAEVAGAVVRTGYDALSWLYRGDDDFPEEYAAWIEELRARIPGRARVLDLGCGCGIPVARELAAAGHDVTGVDLSQVQVERARTLVPDGTFVCADMTELDLADGCYDAIVCLYALIHVPLDRQPALLASIARWLAPGGWLLLTAGWRSWTGSEDGWLGGPAAMWWSHADVDTYRRWLTEAGLVIRAEAYVPEDESGHSLFWAQQEAGAT